MLKTIHLNKNLNAPFFRTTTNVILSPSFLRGSAHSIPVFAEMGKNCQIIILKKCLVIKCQLPLIKSKRTVHPTWTLCFFWYLGTFAFMLISHVHSALEQRGTHQSLAAVHGTHTHHCFELIYLTNKKSTI